MYRFMLHQCQEKNDMQVEKVATIFSISFEYRAMRSELVMGFQESEHQSREKILPCMREDAGTKTAAKQSKQTEERSENRKQDHVARALISMRRAEEEGGDDHAHNHRAPRPCGELAMQIAAKHHLFRDSGENAKKNPRDRFARIARRQLSEGVQR